MDITEQNEEANNVKIQSNEEELTEKEKIDKNGSEKKDEQEIQEPTNIDITIENNNTENENKINNEPEINNIEIPNKEKELEKEEEKEVVKENKPVKQKKKDASSSKKVNKSKSTKIKIVEKNSNVSNKEDKVYAHNKFRNENIKNYIKEKELQEIGECSFKPKINKKIGFEINNADNNASEKEKNNGDVVDRLMQWKERVQKKKNDIINKKVDNAQEGCTFNPKLNSEVPKFEETKVNGTKRYLDRIKNSRELQKQKEERLNPNYDKLYNKYYKKKEKTVLDKNKKLTNKEYQNYLNVFHNALMNDDD